MQPNRPKLPQPYGDPSHSLSGEPLDRNPLDETTEQPLLKIVAPARKTNTQPLEDIFPLWRRQLRLAALFMFVGFAIFLIRRILGIYSGLEPRSAAEWFMLWCNAAITTNCGLFGLLLSSRRPSSFFRLCTAELALFGFPTAIFLASQYFVTLQACSEWRVFAFSGGPWLVLIFIYALFIPSTLWRATVVIGTISASPILLVIIMALRYPQVAAVVTGDDLTGILLLFPLAGVIGVAGAHKITSLRRETVRAIQLGQYRLKSLIGSGGMGEVFLAEHEMLKRPCVIKLIRRDKAGDETILTRFHREVQATARLSHWNTVEIFDYGRTEDGTLYCVMEYLPGMSLARIVSQYGPMPPERAIYLLLQVCDALQEAHESGLVHRDLKPANIFVSQRGGVYDVAKLLDFGLVKQIVDDSPVELTIEGTVTGSPLFMSPEQAVGEPASDVRSDIYSLGASAYYQITGRPPFSSDNLLKLVIAHAKETPTPPSVYNPAIPKDLERIILKCLAKEPSERFQSIAELNHALMQCEAASHWSRAKAAQWWKEQNAMVPLV